MFQAVFLIGFFFSVVTHAYVPPVSFILDRMIKDHSKIKSLEMEGKITNLAAHWSGREALKIDFSSNRMVAVYTNDKGEVLGQKISKLTEAAPLGQAWIAMNADPNGSRIRGMMVSLQLDPADSGEVKLGRMSTRPMWTWGKSNVVSVEKDEFLVSSLRMNTTSIPEKMNEYWVQEFSPISNGVRLPRIVRIKKAGQDLYQYELTGFKVNLSGKELAAQNKITGDRPGAFKEWVELVR